MDGFNSDGYGGSLQISTEVIEKIARHAALEVKGVTGVKSANSAAKSLIEKISQQKAVIVAIKNDVADVTVSIVVGYGVKIPEICEQVQQNVKEAIQSMTSISVARVDVVVSGLEAEKEENIPKT